MEFFDWLNVPQAILQYFNGYLGRDFSTATSTASFMLRINLICIIVAAVLFVVGTVFGGIGLMTMAKRRGVKHGWLGFVPFANTFYAEKFAGECNIFGKKIKHIGLWSMLAEIIYVGLNVFTLVVNLMLMSNPAYYAPHVIEETGQIYYSFSSDLLFGGMRTLALASDVISIISTVWWLITLFLFCSLFFGLFRKYYARSPFLMTFLCVVLPCRGFVLFAVRNNTPIDYNEYIRKRMEEERRRYEERYGTPGDNGENGSYGGSGGYGGNSGNGGNGGDSPFPDFDGTKGSGRNEDGPFSDF